MKNIIFLAFLFSLLLQSCGNKRIPNSLITGSTQYLYNPSINRLHPQYFVSNTSSGNSRLYVKIYLSDIRFINIDTINQRLKGKIKVKYEIYSPENLDLLVDSASNIYDVIKRKGQNNIITYINIKANLLNEYYLKVTTTDIYKGISVYDYIFVSNENSSKQNFLVSLQNNNYPYFKNYFNKSYKLSIKTNNSSKDSIFIRYYKRKIPIPYPPASILKRDSLLGASDSTWSVPAKSILHFNEDKLGLYLFQTDTTDIKALSLINKSHNYPFIKFPSEMLFPLQYIAKTSEFNKMYNSTNIKLAIDRFWLSCGNNPQKSRELIKIYYNRTLYANVHFTSFTNGWKTDRGMIYLIFGPPKAVKKTAKLEEWIYSDRLNEKLLIFKFNKIDNILSNNDYVLNRHDDFRSFWNAAIKSWREGKVYSVF